MRLLAERMRRQMWRSRVQQTATRAALSVNAVKPQNTAASFIARGDLSVFALTLKTTGAGVAILGGAEMPITFKARAYKRLKKLSPEVRLCLGATAEGVTGSGSYSALFGTRWALALDRDGGLHLLRESGASWAEAVPLSPLPVLPKTARHVGLAFDQAARPVVCWENLGEVFVRQYDVLSGRYVVRGGFSGVDPVLVMDAQLLRTTGNSDVHLFFLSQDRKTVFYRSQRDQYAIEYVSSAFLDSMILDAVIIEQYQYKIILFNTITNTNVMLESLPYSAKEFLRENVNLSGGITGGGEFTSALNPLLFESVNVSAGITGGDEV